MVAGGVTPVLLSRLMFILKRNYTNSRLSCDLNRLQRWSLFQQRRFTWRWGAVHAPWLETVRLSLTGGLEILSFEETQPTLESLEIHKFQPEVFTASQSALAQISFLWFSERNFPHLILICRDCVGTCRLFKASVLKDRGHL